MRKPTGKPSGRPAFYGEKMPIWDFSCPEELHIQLKKKAKKLGMSINEFLRRAVKLALKQQFLEE